MKKIIIGFLLIAYPFISWADFVVVVSDQNRHLINPSEVRNLYLGKVNGFANGDRAEPLMLVEGAPDRLVFLQTFLNVSESRYISIWAKLLFTGNGTPPAEFENYSQMGEYILQNPAAIGYLPRSVVDQRYRIIIEFDTISTTD